MDPRVTSIQPGGGYVMSLELLWGKLRRAFVRLVFPGYVEEMAARRLGDKGAMPFEPVDSRDLKFYLNQTDSYWMASEDRFRWRESIPFARWGLAELLLMSLFWLAVGIGLLVGLFFVEPTWLKISMGIGSVGAFVCIGLIVWFFRDPLAICPCRTGPDCLARGWQNCRNRGRRRSLDWRAGDSHRDIPLNL